MMRHVDLCSGIGGFALGFEWAELSSPVLFCDIEPWSRKILAKHWPDVPIADDVKELANDPDGLIPDCDILTAGYPCQPFSVAGQRKGQEDDRHIWPYIRKIVAQKRPAWCVFENVYGHISLGLDEVLSDLEVEGYAARTFIVPACATDAPHRRDRVWIIARNVGDTKHDGSLTSTIKRSLKEAGDNKSEGQSEASQSEGASQPRDSASMAGSARANNVGDTRCAGGKSRGNAEAREKTFGGAAASQYKRSGQNVACAAGGQAGLWLLEPAVGRVANGIPRRVDRLRGLGNAIVPQIAMRIGMTIKQMK